MGVDLGHDAPTPGLYRGGDTGSRVANPDIFSIAYHIINQLSSNFATIYVHFTVHATLFGQYIFNHFE